ncbi:tetratricopeptide repeat protein [Corallincola spongiicola]|uniref:histidine kinase n=1 Tax=Corallincola spongiicola TaxID=2520508 RepID=A0ABY1WM81_9GAMM|nr:tetratricopeptide repeat protein [Corallincola spongiicola]TAA42700.1 tetratricopeptide repeat protein [Corallincola spongiicola]
MAKQLFSSCYLCFSKPVCFYWLLAAVLLPSNVGAVDLVGLHQEPNFSRAIQQVEDAPAESLSQLSLAIVRVDSTDRKARISYLMGRANMALGAPDAAIVNYQDSRELALALADDELLHRSDYGIASIYLYHDNPVLALDIFKRLRINDEKRGNLKRLGSTLNNIGVSYRLLGKLDLAMQYFIEALVYKEQYENPISVARTLTNIGEIELDMGQFDAAKARLLQAEMIFTQEERGKDLMRVLNLLGNVEASAGQFDAAMRHYQKALDYYQRHGPEAALAQSYQNIADLYARQNQPDKSIALYEKALELSDDLSDGVLSPDIAVRLGNAYLDKQQPAVALEIYQQAMAQVGTRTLGAYEGPLLLGLSRASEAMGDYQQALAYLKQFQSSTLGLQHSEMRMQAQELHQKFGVAEKEASIRLLEQENALRESELAAQAYQRNFWLSGSLVLLLGFSFLTYRQRSRRLLMAEKASVTETILEKKRTLFANISHEFRTPLTLILGPLHQLKSADTPELKRQSLLAQIELNAQRMLRMVEQVLQLAKLEAGEERDAKRVLLDQLVAQTTLELRPLFEQKRIQLTTAIAPDCCLIGDHDLLEKVVVNLLSNAVKYTPEGGRVAASLTAENEKLKLVVTDSGIGMTDEAMKQIFERFVRAHVDVEGTAGVGIGLALVKEVVEAHKGEISVSSRVNEGTVFTVVLPRYMTLEALATSLPASESGQVLTAAPLPATQSAAASPVASNSDSEQAADQHDESVRPKVLIIDDHPEIVAMVADVLANQYHCITETDSPTAVQIAIEQVPDLIITDLMMPSLDGFEVSRLIRDNPATSHIPLMLLTAKGDDESRLKAWQSDIDAYLSKPFNPDELQLRCAGLIKVRRLIAQKLQLRDPQPEQSAESSGTQQPNQESAAGLNQRDRQFVEKLEGVLAQHYSQSSLDKALIANAVAMSERQLQRKMQALFGQTPTDYVRSFRLKLAADALQAGEAVTQVASAVGFSSPAYFSQCFKQKFGMSPSDFVRQQTSSG